MCKIDFVVLEGSDKKDGKYLKDFLGIKVCEMSSHSPVGKVMRESVRDSHVLARMLGVTLSPPHWGGRVEGGTPAVDAKVSTGDERENMGMRSTYANRRYRHRNLQRELERENRVFQAKCHPSCNPSSLHNCGNIKGEECITIFLTSSIICCGLVLRLWEEESCNIIHLRESSNRYFLH